MEKKPSDLSSKLAEFTVGFHLDAVPAKALENAKIASPSSRTGAAMTYDERAELPGVSTGRAAQLLAGAIVAEAVMSLLDVDEVQVCPWALREGIILRRLDWIRPDD